MATIDVAMESSVQAVKTVADNIYAKVDTEIATINTNLNTVDGIVDTINSNVSANKTTLGTVNTNVNNINSNMSKESTSQSILSKLNSGIGEKAYTPSNNLAKTVLNSEMSAWLNDKLIGKWIPEKSGVVKVNVTAKAGSNIAYIHLISDSFYRGESGVILAQNVADAIAYMNALSVGAEISSDSLPDETLRISVQTSSTTYSELGTILFVEKGHPVYFMLDNRSSSNNGYCNSIKIYADEV